MQVRVPMSFKLSLISEQHEEFCWSDNVITVNNNNMLSYGNNTARFKYIQ